jgi:hypothetical protein
VTVGIGDQIHHQYPVEIAVCARHVHAGLGQREQRIHFGVFPRFFLFFAAEFAGLADRPRLAAAAHFAAFLILHPRLEAALRQGLQGYGAADIVAHAHDVHRGFFAAFQRAQDFIDHAIIDQRLQSFGGLHRIVGLRRNVHCRRVEGIALAWTRLHAEGLIPITWKRDGSRRPFSVV